MESITITIPKKLERKLGKLPKSELRRSMLDFLTLKVMELELENSKETQRGMLELLASKSRLTTKLAHKLSRKLELKMAGELKASGLA